MYIYFQIYRRINSSIAVDINVIWDLDKNCSNSGLLWWYLMCLRVVILIDKMQYRCFICILLGCYDISYYMQKLRNINGISKIWFLTNYYASNQIAYTCPAQTDQRTQLHQRHLPFLFLAMPCGMPCLSYPTRDQTHAPCIGRAESWPLDHQGIPCPPFLSLHWRGSSLTPTCSEGTREMTESIIVRKDATQYCHISDSATLWTLAHQALLSVEFSRQEYWRG